MFNKAIHRFVLPAILLVSCSGGGEEEGTRNAVSADLGNINIVNTTANSGAAVAEVVLPLNQGDLMEVPQIRTDDDEACQVTRMGPVFPDGSLRYLRMEIPVTVEPNEQKTIGLQTVGAGNPEFRKHSAIQGDIGIEATLKVGNVEVAFPTPVLIEQGPITRVFRSRVRAEGTMIWGELTVNTYSDLPHAKFTLQWGNSDPRRPELIEDPGKVYFEVRGANVEFEHKEAKILSEEKVADRSTVKLHDGGGITDGQSQLVEGRLLFGEVGSPPRVAAIADNWVATGTYGPFGYLIPEIPIDPGQFESLIENDQKAQQDHPWAASFHGCNPDPKDTGHQNDFGVIMMRPDVLLADPRRLPTIIRSIYQEACRPVHFREVDVSRVQLANHPDLLMLGCRPKITESKDLLGKVREYAPAGMRTGRDARWQGHDPEHVSINYLAGIALLTGNRFAREECDVHRVAYLSSFTYQTGGWTDLPGPARSVGRSSLAAIWAFLVTGDTAISTRVSNRSKDLLVRMGQANTRFPVIADRGTYWVPWEEGIGLAGLKAIHHNFGTPECLSIMELASATVVINGIGKGDQDQWRCGYKPPYTFANGDDYIPLLDPNFQSTHAAGSGLTTWTMPAVVIAAESHPNGLVREHALKILQERHGHATQGMAPELDWLCVSGNIPALSNMIGVQ